MHAFQSSLHLAAIPRTASAPPPRCVAAPWSCAHAVCVCTAAMASSEASGGQTREELKRLFGEFDADGSGGISRHEFELITQRMGVRLKREELDALMLERDADQSGVIEFDEFEQMVKKAKGGAIQDTICALKASYLDEAAVAAGATECEWYTDAMIVEREKLRHNPEASSS